MTLITREFDQIRRNHLAQFYFHFVHLNLCGHTLDLNLMDFFKETMVSLVFEKKDKNENGQITGFRRKLLHFSFASDESCCVFFQLHPHSHFVHLHASSSSSHSTKHIQFGRRFFFSFSPVVVVAKMLNENT